ncbi:DUF4193 family protein [Frondihabitans sp. PAMC 28766]|uniref:DUF4193 family protein n=1 Tax=Frondihabitans sp. PAMC 28766 TaxID=1795630 RepID=UPI0009E76FD7|nr:DUF4193 family protein [Frondihabitans sp. PAMC 28766]
MAADYDAPRSTDTDESAESIEAFKDRAAQNVGLVADLDDGDTSGGFDLEAVDVDADLDVIVLPVQEVEFTCVECFLVRHHVMFDHDTTLGPVCVECAA